MIMDNNVLSGFENRILKVPSRSSEHWFWKIDCRVFSDSDLYKYRDELYMLFNGSEPCGMYVFRIDESENIYVVESAMKRSRFVVLDVILSGKNVTMFSSGYRICSCVFDTRTDRIVAVTEKNGVDIYGNAAVFRDGNAVVYLPSATVSFELPCGVKVVAESEDEVVVCDDDKKYGFLATINKESGEVTVVKDIQKDR